MGLVRISNYSTRANHHILGNINIDIQTSSRLLDSITLSIIFNVRRSNGNSIIGLSRNLANLLVHITNHSSSSRIFGKSTNLTSKSIDSSLRASASSLSFCNRSILTISIGLCNLHDRTSSGLSTHEGLNIAYCAIPGSLLRGSNVDISIGNMRVSSTLSSISISKIKCLNTSGDFLSNSLALSMLAFKSSYTTSNRRPSANKTVSIGFGRSKSLASLLLSILLCALDSINTREVIILANDCTLSSIDITHGCGLVGRSIISSIEGHGILLSIKCAL